MATPSESDIKMFENSLNLIWSSKLKVVFQDRKLLAKILCLVFDKDFLYIFTKINLKLKGILAVRNSDLGYKLYIIPHRVTLKNKDVVGWQTGIKKIEFLDYFPKRFITTSQLIWPRISGPTASLFLKIQAKIQKRWRPLNPYTTSESYVATIIHEFGHAYFGSKYKAWHGEKLENLKTLRAALALFEEKKVHVAELPINIPLCPVISETFAFCCEYFAAEMFWPEHKNNIDQEMVHILPSLIEYENKTDLNFLNSVLDSREFLHYNAVIFSKLLLNKYGLNWPSYFC